MKFSDLPTRNGSFIYDVDCEKKIIHNLKKNNLSESISLLHSFVKDLLKKSGYNYYDTYEGMLQLLISVIAKMNEMGYPYKEIFKDSYGDRDFNLLDEFRKLETVTDVQSWMEERFKNISDFLWNRRNGKDECLINNVIGYIEQNFNKDLYLSIVAETFKVSEGFLSRTFKEVIGNNFLDYLTEFRIDKAKGLLKDTTKSVQDISHMVGYSNVQSFIRIFKKKEGITPGQFRDDLKIIENIEEGN